MLVRLLKTIGCPVFIVTIVMSYWAWLFRRAFLVAFVAASIWSLGGSFGWQIPAGMDVVSGPIPTGLEGPFWKAAAILFVALALCGRQPGLKVTESSPKSIAVSLLVLGLAVALFGLFLDQSFLCHPLSIAFALVFGFDLLLTANQVPADQDEQRPTLAFRAGLVLSGIGVSLALQALNSRIELWGLGEPAEDSLRAALFLGLAAFGAIAAAGYLNKPGARRAVLGAGPLYVCLAVVASFTLLAPLASHGGLEVFLRTFGQDLSQIGQVKGLALIGARGLFLPGLALGVLLASAAKSEHLTNLALGLALGVALLPVILPEFSHASDKSLPSANLVRFAFYTCAFPLAGWLLVTFGERGTGDKRSRVMAAGLLLPAAALGLWLPATPVQPLTPWVRFEAEPFHLSDTPLGLVTVEQTSAGGIVLTVDRFLITPDAPFEASDEAQFRASLNYLASSLADAEGRTLRILLAGQITPRRSALFQEWRLLAGLNAELDWTVPWTGEVNQVRPLFEFAGKLGDPTAPDLARTRLDDGHYDMVLSLATYGPEITAMSAEAPPQAPGLMAGGGGTAGKALAILWNDTRVPLDSARLPGRALIAGSDLEHMAIGLVTWPEGQSQDQGTYATASTGDNEQTGWQRLTTRPELRVFGDRARLFARLAKTESADQAAFLLAVSGLMSLQNESSPWEEPDIRFEIEAGALDQLLAATQPEPDDFQRMTWNHIARVLVAKRLPEISYNVLPGLLEQTSGSWPEIEYALSRAYQEFLMPAEAAELLSPLFDADLLNLVPLLDYAAAEGQSGNWVRSAEVLTRALSTAPHNHGIERHLAIAEMQSGNPAGVDRIKHLMETEPEDPDIQELGAYLLPGPMPAPPMGFDPAPLGSHEDH